MLKFWHRTRPNRIFSLSQVLTAAQNFTIHKRKADNAAQIEKNYLLQTSRQLHIGNILEKSNKQSKRQQDRDNDDDSDDDEDGKTIEQFADERDSKVIKSNLSSLRADLLLKAGLGMARNKVETIFYESKIRVNGNKLSKKSIPLHVGDEIDVIRGFSHSNPNHLVVSRVIVLDASDREEGYSVQLRRYKSLLIENYAGTNAYKSSEQVQH